MAAPKKKLLPAIAGLQPKTAAPGAAGRPPALAAPAPVAAPTAGGSGLKGRAVATTLYLLPEDHRRLRILAIERGTSLQGLVMDALDGLLTSAGEGVLTRWETRRKRG